MPQEQVQRQLVRLGLSLNEAIVYLAALECGSCPVQTIAKQAGINRPTAYAIIESLIEQGLMNSVERDNRRYFSAEPPERLQHLVRREQARVEEMQNALQKIMPELATLISHAPERPRVRFYEGFEGLEAMRSDFFKDSEKDELLLISAADDYHKIVGLARRLPHAKKIEQARGLERCIFTSSRPVEELKKAMPPVSKVERYRIPKKEYPLAGEITVHGTKVAMLSYQGKVMGVIVESPYLAQTAKSLFKLAWETAKQHEKFD